jgi:hypothetical protein
MYVGIGIFAFVAVLCVVAFIATIRKRRKYERSG